MTNAERQFGWMHVMDVSAKEPITHIVPINDSYTHDTDNCWCCPTDDGYEVIHNAADCREDYEDGRRKLN